MLVQDIANRKADFVADAFAAIAFELALEQVGDEGRTFDTVIARACLETGARLLFAMPPSSEHLGIVQLAAVRLGRRVADGSPLVFVVQEAGLDGRIRLAGREETRDRFFGFAKAYAQLMGRLMPIRSTARA